MFNNKDMDNIKNKILNEFLSLNSNSKKSEVRKVQKELARFQKDYGFDAQIDNALLIAKLNLAKLENENLVELTSNVSIIFKRLENSIKWGLIDIETLSLAFEYAENYNQIIEFTERAIVQLEEHHKNSKTYNNIKIILYLNALSKLLNIKYRDVSYGQENSKLLNEKFSQYFEIGLKLCEESEKYEHSFIYKNIFIVRKAVFDKDGELIQEILELLIRKEKEIYNSLNAEINSYSRDMGIHIARNQFNMMIGENLREIRLEHNMSHEEVAELLGIKKANIGAYERGDQSLSSLYVYKLASIFKTSFERIYYGNNKETSEKISNKEALRNEIFAYTSNMTEEKLELLIKQAIKINESK
ncbi:MAG: helix-turn-helix domain-containing protein [Defluviitaleaceae bacterium]|nr:helix-turn-helix domain-containing protein [Defluviitaleaceae bacterium]